MNDQYYMQLAIELAKRGLYTASPNPRVGCVLVRNGGIIGQGYHLCRGKGHAETNAIADAGGDVSSATAYVTLEPCSHTGNTPPCCEVLIAAQVHRVVIAMIDPNPQVSGRGVASLRKSGIEVTIGEQESDARALNPGFIKRMQTGMPWLRAKLAMSLDGRTAMASGESQWITGPSARSDVQRLRAQSCAIITGVETVIADDASLTVRESQLGIDPELAKLAVQQQPLRMVLDSQLRLPPSAKILSATGRTIIFAAVENRVKQQALETAGAEVIYRPDGCGRVDLQQALQWLAQHEYNEILLEAGATLAGAMVQAGLIDHLTVYMAPKLLGSTARPLVQLTLESMAQQQLLTIENISPVGSDWRIDATLS